MLRLVSSRAVQRNPGCLHNACLQLIGLQQEQTINSFLCLRRIPCEPVSIPQDLQFCSRSRYFSSTPPPFSRKENSKDNNTENDESKRNHVANADASDPSTVTWVDEYLPSTLQPYARLARMDKPIGTFLLLWPCYWSTALAAPPGAFPDPTLLALFGVGAFVMRGAGCTINDMWDTDFDKRVTRTRTRPLASGELSQTQAFGFLAVQLSAGLGVLLSLPHTYFCFQLGALSLPLAIAYPLMKRYTNWPQLVLGMTFNWGALMGWAATHGSLDLWAVGPLYLSGVTWTLVYDTLYAHQDKADDAKLGLKSTALYFGPDFTKPILHGFAVLSWMGWMASGYHVGYETPLFYAGTSLAYGHLVWQIQTANLGDAPNLAARFRSNHTVGALVFASTVAGNVLMAAG